MTERERLTEILEKFRTDDCKITHLCGYCDFDDLTVCSDAVADHLLANGVIAPPVKIGDTIYVPCKDGFSAKKVEKIEIYSNTTLIGFGWRGGGYELVSASDVGKAFFLTPEDAERAPAEWWKQ